MFTIQMVAAFIAIVGAVMFIVAGVVLGDPNSNRLPPADGVQIEGSRSCLWTSCWHVWDSHWIQLYLHTILLVYTV